MKQTTRIPFTLLTLALLAATFAPAPAAAQARIDDDDARGVSTLGSALPEALSSAFREAADRALQGVVFVSVERHVDSPVFIPRAQREFFNVPEDMPESQSGSGSGFIYDASGLVLTNHHVVANAEGIRVRLHDGHVYPAELVASDPTTDVAVVRVNAPPGVTLPVVEIGSSEHLRTGDWVLALGNPLGLDFTVTAGIVSATGRQLAPPGGGRLESYIQTDAAINPGNSGGPLIDLRGRVVGINTAISGSRFIGYGFAVPIEMAQRVATDLVAIGYVRRPQLGVGVDGVTEVDAEVYGLRDVAGAEVLTVMRGSAAEAAGLQVGDVIVALDGERVRDATALTAALALYQPGDDIELRVVRDGAERTVRARLGEFPNEPRITPVLDTEDDDAPRLGFQVSPLTPSVAREFDYRARDAGVTAPEEGVVVTNVMRGSDAWLAGLRPGQVLRRVNGVPVDDVSGFERATANAAPGSALSLRVLDPNAGETIVNFRVR